MSPVPFVAVVLAKTDLENSFFFFLGGGAYFSCALGVYIYIRQTTDRPLQRLLLVLVLVQVPSTSNSTSTSTSTSTNVSTSTVLVLVLADRDEYINTQNIKKIKKTSRMRRLQIIRI